MLSTYTKLLKLKNSVIKYYSTSNSYTKINLGTKYDGHVLINSIDIYKLSSDNIPLELKENPPILGKDWPYVSVHSLNSDGYIDSELPKSGGVYAYQLIISPNKLYVGMSTNLSYRHKIHVNNVYYGLDHSPIFYAAVNKYGWDSFRLCILETVDSVDSKDPNVIKTLYSREQFYFDLFRPCYNVNLIAAPGTHGYTWTEEQSLQHSIRQRGVPKNRRKTDNSVSTKRSVETNIKMRSRSVGTIVEVYEDNNLILTFDSLTKAGEYFNVRYSTIQRYADSTKLWDNKYLFKLTPKVDIDNVDVISDKSLLLPLDPTITKSTNPRGTVVDVYNKDNELVYKFNTVTDACKYMHITANTLLRLVKSGELYLNKWYFKQHKR